MSAMVVLGGGEEDSCPMSRHPDEANVPHLSTSAFSLSADEYF